MTIQCRNVLKNLRNLSSNTENDFAFLADTNYICLELDTSQRYDYTKYEYEINSIIKQLVTDGYLEYGHNEYYFSLTHKGLHPHQFQWDVFKPFLFKSIIVPIVVSFFTTLGTLLLQWLLASK